MHLRRLRLAPLIALALIACAVLASGCGDGGSSDGGGEIAQAGGGAPPEPPEGSPEAFATELSDAVAGASNKKKCGPLNAINQRSTYRFPCPPGRELQSSLAVLEVLDSHVYDTAARVDYRSGRSPKGATMLLYKTPRDVWSIGQYGLNASGVEVEDEQSNRSGFDKAAAAYVDAVRDRDCAKFADYAVTSTQDEQIICSKVFPKTEPMAKMLQANPAAAPKYLGSDGVFAFYSVAGEQPTPAYYTLGLAFVDPKAVYEFQVLDAVQGPPGGG